VNAEFFISQGCDCSGLYCLVNGTLWNAFNEDEEVIGESKIDLFDSSYEFFRKLWNFGRITL
jgi:hypothetical protein